MPSVKGKLARLLASVVLTRATVVSAHSIGGFARLELRGGAEGLRAGDKLQLLLPSDDVRTYTPVPSAEGMLLLAWTHAGGPGARFMATVRTGDELAFMGPARSLRLGAGPVVWIGDETSVAVAAAFAAERPGRVHAVIQAAASSELRAAAESVGLTQLEVVERGDPHACVTAALAQLERSADAQIAVTGGSELVVSVRAALRGAGVQNVQTKTYWIPGRAGLD